MLKSICATERYARYIAGIAAVLALLLLLAFQMDWIRSSAVYRIGSWYLIDTHSNYFVATEFTDELSCQGHLREGQRCKSGSDMVVRELADQDTRLDATRSAKFRT